MAQDVVEALELDRLLFVPARRPPHKREMELTPAGLRLQMVRAAVEWDARIEVSEVELRREGASYTVDTLRAVRERRPDERVYFVVGADQFGELSDWREPEEVARLARLVVMTRDGEEPGPVDPGVQVPYEVVPVTRIDISSTEVRRRVREGRSIRYLVPEAVRRIIEENGLYRGTP